MRKEEVLFQRISPISGGSTLFILTKLEEGLSQFFFTFTYYSNSVKWTNFHM
jgi:hypothetical protein